MKKEGIKIEEFEITLNGLSDFLFNRFIDHSKEVRPPEQLLYLAEGNLVILPREHIYSFLTNQKVGGVIKKVEKRGSGEYLDMAHSHISIKEDPIPFLREGKPVVFENFSNGTFYKLTASPVTKPASGPQVIKQPAYDRPCLRLPWSLNFHLTLIENPKITEAKLRNWFETGGILVALGSYRPRYGRFTVEWKKIT